MQRIQNGKCYSLLITVNGKQTICTYNPELIYTSQMYLLACFIIFKNATVKESFTEAGTMAQRLRVLVALEEDSQHLHGGSQPFITPVPEDLVPSLTSMVIKYTVMHRHTCRKTLTQKINLFNKKQTKESFPFCSLSFSHF